MKERKITKPALRTAPPRRAAAPWQRVVGTAEERAPLCLLGCHHHPLPAAMAAAAAGAALP
jgi:hypothetical protein